MTLLDGLLSALLGLWFLATIAKHIPERWLPLGWRGYLKGGLASLLLPSWNFFAPRPGVYSYHVLYRDRSRDGEMSDWREVNLDRSRAWWCVLWNPAKTVKKAIVDIVLELSQTADIYRERRPLITISMPYLSLLSYIASLPRIKDPVATQFLVFQSTPDTHDILFLSDLHSL